MLPQIPFHVRQVVANVAKQGSIPAAREITIVHTLDSTHSQGVKAADLNEEEGAP